MPRQDTLSWSIVGVHTLNTLDLKLLDGIALEGDEPVFAEPWEAQAFALVIGLYEKGAFSWQEWADTLSETIHTDDGCKPYYELWLNALETIVQRKALTSETELANRKIEWQQALLATPHGQPIELKNADKS